MEEDKPIDKSILFYLLFLIPLQDILSTWILWLSGYPEHVMEPMAHLGAQEIGNA